jgi:hypothetical protein
MSEEVIESSYIWCVREMSGLRSLFDFFEIKNAILNHRWQSYIQHVEPLPI